VLSGLVGAAALPEKRSVFGFQMLFGLGAAAVTYAIGSLIGVSLAG
jgi:hypothetical protein